MIYARRWARVEYEQMIETGLFRPDERLELLESSLSLDRGRKATLYARAGIQDYWIVNLAEGALEVHRQPVATPETAAGWRYLEIRSDRTRPSLR